SDDRVVLQREYAGFPLRKMPGILVLHAAYRHLVQLPRVPPLHIVKDPGHFQTLPGIFPPEPEALYRAGRAFVIGACFGGFAEEGGILVYRQPLPGMAIEETHVIGTRERPLRALHYLLDHPDLLAELDALLVPELTAMLADSALCDRRLTQVERLYSEIVAACRDRAGGTTAMPRFPEDPLWAVAQAILDLGEHHGFERFRTLARPAAGVAVPGEDMGILARPTHCPSCGTPCMARARFCIQCATPLPHGDYCDRCGEALPPRARFCPGCALQVPVQRLRR
ncbi:MAG: zinc ribbon domain-containing protein, partial [Cyanobacteria bacterium REEB65]|nr:zinc ribbon domain-containing protein [Cyanobacteria bacterium REEB65]